MLQTLILLLLSAFVLSINNESIQMKDSIPLACNDTEYRIGCFSMWKWDVEEKACVDRGCCWQSGGPKPDDVIWCYYPDGAINITTVHVIQGCHFDAGFANTLINIINEWFDNYFPKAYQVGKQLEDQGANNTVRLKFTAPSWLVSLYVDCPLNFEGIHCPNATNLQMFSEAVAHDWVTWHALPWNGESEMMDKTLIEAGLYLTHNLDERFNKTKKATLSQRDVPGMTRSIIPILKAQNITTISVGVNGGSTPPDVPKAFIWKDTVSGESIRALYLQGGYSGLQIGGLYVATIVPGLSHAMVVDWRGDNAGPPDADEVYGDFADIQRLFPHATIISSTFDEFAAIYATVPDENLPIITSEIGDTWIHGVMSDPLKFVEVRHAQRLNSQCIKNGECSFSDTNYFNFSRLFLKNPEHTWGLDQKKTIIDLHHNWSNAEFNLVRNNSDYQKMEESWREQRRWGLEDAVNALGSHPLAQQIRNDWAQIAATWPSTQGYTPIAVSSLPKTFACERYTIGFDSATGAINFLLDSASGIQWVVRGLLNAFEYRTYDATDYREFMLEYNYVGPFFPLDDWDDYDKVGIDDGGAKHQIITPKLQEFYIRNQTDMQLTNFLYLLAMPEDAYTLAGSWRSIWVQIDVPWKNNNISLTTQLFNKTATRLPEAMFLRFYPAVTDLQQGLTYGMEKLGLIVNPQDVVIGGAKRTHVVSDGGVFFHETKTNKSLQITAPDAALIVWGEPTSFPTPTSQQPDFTQGVSFNLFDNIWNTNYIMWYPYNAGDESIKYTFSLILS